MFHPVDSSPQSSKVGLTRFVDEETEGQASYVICSKSQSHWRAERGFKWNCLSFANSTHKEAGLFEGISNLHIAFYFFCEKRNSFPCASLEKTFSLTAWPGSPSWVDFWQCDDTVLQVAHRVWSPTWPGCIPAWMIQRKLKIRQSIFLSPWSSENSHWPRVSTIFSSTPTAPTSTPHTPTPDSRSSAVRSFLHTLPTGVF